MTSKRLLTAVDPSGRSHTRLSSAPYTHAIVLHTPETPEAPYKVLSWASSQALAVKSQDRQHDLHSVPGSIGFRPIFETTIVSVS